MSQQKPLGKTMPLFDFSNSTLRLIRPMRLRSEKQLQRLVEQNLGSFFSCRFVATEFSRGMRRQWRIDTLALSENDHPVIIEYKLTESRTLLNQGLCYRTWLDDHRGDFELAARQALGVKTRVDWGEIRLLCIAPSFSKYDLQAVQSIERRIELWSYQCFGKGILQLVPVFGGIRSKALGAPSGMSPRSL
jgi:hypothetical protein